MSWQAADAADPIAALRTLAQQTDDQLLLLHSHAALPALAAERLGKALADDPDAVAVSPLGNADQSLWPLPHAVAGKSLSATDRSAVEAAHRLDPELLDRWIFGFSQRLAFTTELINPACSLWRPAAIAEAELTASENLLELGRNLVAAGQRLLAVDHLYVAHDSGPPRDASNQNPDALETLRVRLRRDQG